MYGDKAQAQSLEWVWVCKKPVENLLKTFFAQRIVSNKFIKIVIQTLCSLGRRKSVAMIVLWLSLNKEAPFFCNSITGLTGKNSNSRHVDGNRCSTTIRRHHTVPAEKLLVWRNTFPCYPLKKTSPKPGISVFLTVFHSFIIWLRPFISKVNGNSFRKKNLIVTSFIWYDTRWSWNENSVCDKLCLTVTENCSFFSNQKPFVLHFQGNRVILSFFSLSADTTIFVCQSHDWRFLFFC